MKIIGHRGAKGLATENTLASFEAALAQQVDGIECDARVTKDGIVVLSHSARLAAGSKFMNRGPKINKYEYSFLKAKNPDSLTLDECLRYVKQRVPLYIEIKKHTPAAPVVTVIEHLIHEGWRPSSFKFLSFDYKLLQDLHLLLPEIPIVVNELWSGVRACSRAKRLGTRDIDLYSPIVWSVFVRIVTKNGYRLTIFPDNNVKRCRRLEAAGLYGVVTDYPDRFRSDNRENSHL